MSDQLFLGAYWPARRETIEQCADRLGSFVAELAVCDSRLESWCEKGRSRKQALKSRADVQNRSYLVSLLDRGRCRRDVGRAVIEDLGFRVGLWNAGNGGDIASLNVTCGLFWSSPDPNSSVSNCVALDLPEHLGELRNAQHMARALGAVARAWDPDWAGVMSKDRMATRGFDASIPFVDWMLYVSKRLIPGVPRLNAPAVVQQLEELGSIIIAQDEPPVDSDSEHLQGVERVLAELVSQGIKARHGN